MTNLYAAFNLLPYFWALAADEPAPWGPPGFPLPQRAPPGRHPVCQPQHQHHPLTSTALFSFYSLVPYSLFPGLLPWLSPTNEKAGRLLSPAFVVVQSLSHVRLFVGPWTAARQAPLSSTRVCSNSCPLNQCCYPTISSSAAPFSACPQSFPASGSFPKSQLFISGSRSIRTSASASVLPMNIQGWFPLGWTGWISLQSKGLSRSSPALQFESINSSALSLLFGPTVTSVHDYWKNQSSFCLPNPKPRSV